MLSGVYTPLVPPTHVFCVQAASTAAAAAAGSRRASVWDRPARWGKPPTPAVVDKKDYAVFAQYKVTLDSVAASDHGSGNAELMFKIPTTAAPSHIGVGLYVGLPVRQGRWAVGISLPFSFCVVSARV